MYKNHQYAQLSLQDSLTGSTDYHNQFYQGKACGLFTTKEATILLETPAGTSGTIIAADSPTSTSEPGDPRIDSCSHTAIKSSDGYVDLVIKSYASKKDAARYYKEEVSKLFPTEPREAGNLGQQLRYGAGAFHLLKDTETIEVSASRTPRVAEPATEQFSRTVLDTVVAKL